MEKRIKSKTITLSQKDVVIIKWVNKIMAENDKGRLSFLVKQALLYYIHNHSFICLGKICLSEKDNSIEKARINLWLDDVPELIMWLDELASKKVKSNAVIREILKHSIEIVSDESEEWIPTYVDIELLMNKCCSTTERLDKLPVQVTNPVISKNTTDKKEETLNKKISYETVSYHDDDNDDKQGDVQKKTRKVSRAQALLGSSHRNTKI